MPRIFPSLSFPHARPLRLRYKLLTVFLLAVTCLLAILFSVDFSGPRTESSVVERNPDEQGVRDAFDFFLSSSRFVIANHGRTCL